MRENNDKKILLKFYSLIFLPVLTFLYLIFNSIAGALCETNGCSITKTLLNIEQEYLYLIAIFTYTILIFIGSILRKYYFDFMVKLFDFILFNVLICETILISYLYLKTGEICLICTGFYILVLLNYVCFNLTFKSNMKILSVFFIIVTLSLIKLEDNVQEGKINNSDNKYILLQSEKCEYCNKVKEYLKDNNIEYTKEDYIKYKELMNNLDFNVIPVLIIKNSKENIQILNGYKEILKYFNENNNKNIKEQKESTLINFNSYNLNNSSQLKEIDSFNINNINKNNDTEGCSVQKLEQETNCE